MKGLLNLPGVKLRMSPEHWAKVDRMFKLLDTIVEPDERNLPTPNSKG